MSTSQVQNLGVRADIMLVQDSILRHGGQIVELRVNQQQVGNAFDHAGRNRPDVQFTILGAELNGRRIYIEYDRAPPSRALDHATRILANDRDAIVLLKVVDFERPR